MTDEQDRLDPLLVRRKLTKRERFRGAVQRGVNKVKKSDEESASDGGFALNDDVKEFLASRSPYSNPASVQSSTPEAQKIDTTPATPPESKANINHVLHKTHPADVLPHFPTPSRDPPPAVPVPRIDVDRSPRFPHARDLRGEPENAGVVSALRIQDGSGSPTRRKARRKGLAVRFTDNPPTTIGEGGDEAETPTMHLLQERARIRSDAPLPESQQDLRQVSPSQIPRKPVASPAQHTSSQYVSPQSLQSMEFDMTLTPGPTLKSGPIKPTPLGTPEIPVARNKRLRMRAEEGKTLRESFHDASFDSMPD